ncbi:tripeptidyl-peptidase 1 [Pelomyxa schiedti]|nr:tripeptidyl-peptidase 1 [Pelomyxa schiedti]
MSFNASVVRILVSTVLCSVVYATWQASGPVEPDREISLTVALSLNNVPQLKRFLDYISDPHSPNYGHHMSRTQVQSLTSPLPSAVESVERFFMQHHIEYHMSPSRDFAKVRAATSTVELLFAAKLSYFESQDFPERIIRSTNGYHIPREIAEYVSCIGGLTGFPSPKKPIEIQAVVTSITPQYIRDMYSVTVPSSVEGNLQAVVSFLEQYWSNSDLQTFFSYYEQSMLGTQPVNWGTNDQSTPGVEASLDVQYLMGVSETVDTWVYYTPGRMPNTTIDNEPWLDWFATLETQTTLPWVFSISYGDYEPTVDLDYANRVNEEIMKYTASGSTFVLASGDGGVGCTVGVCTRFTPLFPAGSPYVVALGGTTLNTLQNEVGVYFSGGGFSDYFSRPSYQDTLVQNYLSNPDLPPSSFYNTSGRGYPDLSTISTSFSVICGGANRSVAGTSASTPTFAAMLSLINSLRFAKGQTSLGWVNPLLYEAYNYGAFSDITQCQQQSHGCCPYSFATTSKWDPMTGMGVPNWDVLAAFATNPSAFF